MFTVQRSMIHVSLLNTVVMLKHSLLRNQQRFFKGFFTLRRVCRVVDDQYSVEEKRNYYFLKVLINRMKSQLFANAKSKITASQQTISGQNIHLSRQTVSLPVIFTGHVKKRQQKKYIFLPLRFKRTSIFLLFMFLLVGLVRSSCYPVIFNILSGQKRDETKLKFLWPVNMTGNSTKFILNPSMHSLPCICS